MKVNRFTILFLYISLMAHSGWSGNAFCQSAGEAITRHETNATAPAQSPAAQTGSEGAISSSNLQRSGVFKTKGVSQPTGVVWKSEVLCKPSERNFYDTPVVSGGTVYAVCGSSRTRLDGGWIEYVPYEGVYALDAATGKTVWEFKPKRFSLSSIAVAGGMVYVGSHSDYFGGPKGTLYALDAKTGLEKWSFKVKKHSLANTSPAVFDGAVYFNDAGNNLYALDSATGETRWVFNTKATLTTFAILDGTIYFGSSKDLLYAVDAKTGRQIWERNLASTPGHPVISGGLVYFGARNGNIYAHSAETGEQVLKVKPLGQPVSFFAIADETIYYGEAKGFYAVDARTGRERWRFKTGEYCDAPTITEGLVYFPCDDGSMYAVEANTGEKKWSIGSKTLIYYSPYISDGTMYFMMSDGRLYTVR